MTPSSGISANVIDLLVEHDYVVESLPILVSGVPFSFTAVLTMPKSLDLVVVIDTHTSASVKDPDAAWIRVQFDVASLARALDLVRSKRSLTVVFAGRRPSMSLIQNTAAVARVLLANPSPETLDHDLHDALAVLLPLTVETTSYRSLEHWTQVKQSWLEANVAAIPAVVAAADKGSAAVNAAARREIAKPLRALADEANADAAS